MKWVNIAVGAVISLVILLACVYSIYSLYRFFFPRSDVLLSLAVEPTGDGALAIHGRAYVAGTPATAGRVKLTVRRFFPTVRLTLMEEISDGRFRVSGVPPRWPFRSEDRLLVNAEAQVPTAKEVLTGREYAVWNIGRWVVWGPLVALPAALIFAILFSVLFTGNYTPLKNRVAISLTYLVIMSFLVVPFLVPLALNTFPEVREIMAKSPVGFVKVGKVGGTELNQWALNIGSILETSSGESTDVKGKGGLVVPLYVLILATLGGAINMTRKVPKLQADIDVEISIPEHVKERFALMVGQVSRVLGRSEVSPPADRLPKEESAVSQGAEPSPPLSSPLEERQAHINRLRGDLINQYMYLITSPFLAIVTYYLLFLADENLATRAPIVVLISFSAGLMSESFLRTITGYADRYLSRLAESLKNDEGKHRDKDRQREPGVSESGPAGKN